MTCQVIGPTVVRGDEMSNIWDHVVALRLSGWISDLAVIGTPTDGLVPQLPPCP